MANVQRYAELALADLEAARAETLPLYERLTPEQWKRRTPRGEWTVRMLGAHVLSDRWTLEVVASLVGFPEAVPPTYGDRNPNEGNAWLQELDAALSPLEIILRGKRERELLRELMAQVKSDEQVRVLYREFPTGYHDRMHRYDLVRSLEVDFVPLKPTTAAKPYYDRFLRNATLIYALHQADYARFDEFAPSGRTYREELNTLARGEFFQRLCEWLGKRDKVSVPSSNTTIEAMVERVERWTADSWECLVALDEQVLNRRIGLQTVAEELDRLGTEDFKRRELFKAINRRYTWARQAGLVPQQN